MSGALAAGTLLLGKYRIVRELGAGGMGVVLEVVHELTQHRRALKLLNQESVESQEMVERFLREASAAGRIGNPHIIETFDAGFLETGEPYLVMELLEGETLADLIERRKLTMPELVDIFAQACVGAAAAHRAGIVHRDLKPENLFLTDVGGRRFVKLLDFGISKFGPKLKKTTEVGQTLGTPSYMSPEQCRGEDDLDGRSDVYAIGVMLYEQLAGEHPYPTGDLTRMIANVLTAIPEPLEEHNPQLPESLIYLVHRALEKDRNSRFADAMALREALLGVPVGSPPPVSLRAGERGASASLSALDAARASRPAGRFTDSIKVASAASVPPPGVTTGGPSEPSDATARHPQGSNTDPAARPSNGLGTRMILLIALSTFAVLACGMLVFHFATRGTSTSLSGPDPSEPSTAALTSAPDHSGRPTVVVAPPSESVVPAPSEPSASASASGPNPTGPPTVAPPPKPVPVDDLANKGEFRP